MNKLTVFLLVSLYALVNFLTFNYDLKKNIFSNEKSLNDSNIISLIDKTNSKLVITVIDEFQNRKKWEGYFTHYLKDSSFTLRFLDPDQDLIKVSKLKIKKIPAFFGEYNNRKYLHYGEMDDQGFYELLLGLQRLKKKNICWLAGSGEVDSNSQIKNGGMLLKDLLNDKGYEVLVRNADENLSKCHVILSLGPSIDYSESFIRKIKDKKFILSLDHDFQKTNQQELRKAFLPQFEMKNDLIVDGVLSRETGDALSFRFPKLNSAMFPDFSLPVFIEKASSIKINKEFGGEVLLASSKFPNSWAVEDFSEIQQKFEYRTQDLKGPLAVAVFEEKNYFIISSSSFFHNRYMQYKGNQKLILMVISTLLEGAAVKEIKPETEEFIHSESNLRILSYVNLIIFPLIFLLLFFFKRKNDA